MGRVVKSVSFNLNDQCEKKMYEHSMKFSSFSVFMKRLIQNSMNETKQVSNKQSTDISI